MRLEKVEDIANDLRVAELAGDDADHGGDDAIASGARALFGEKYGDEVRVVAMGEGGGNTLGWSVESRGGTHVSRTGDIGLISVVGESGVAAGVRRIEAITGKGARKHANHVAQLAKAAASELRVPIDEVPARLAALLDERKRAERELSDAKKKLAMGEAPKPTALMGCARSATSSSWPGQLRASILRICAASPMKARRLSGQALSRSSV